MVAKTPAIKHEHCDHLHHTTLSYLAILVHATYFLKHCCTDTEMNLLRTVRINLVEKWNKPAVKQAIRRIDTEPHAEWKLVLL